MSRWREELDALVTHRGRALVGYAYVVCGNAHDAEDLVQEALIKVFSRLIRPAAPDHAVVAVDGPDGPTHPEAYVRRAILTLYVDGHRRRARWTEREHLIAEVVQQAGGLASGATVRADVAASLNSLSPQQRACVVLRFYEDFTVPQIARTLGVAEGTVKRRLSEALSRLRLALADPTPTRAPEGETR